MLNSEESRPVVAVDGPAGAGKSTVCRAVAKRLGLTYLDTGALYRAIGYKAIHTKTNPADEAAMARLCDTTDLALKADGDTGNHVLVDGVEVSHSLRNQPVAEAASKASALACVRAKLLDIQREMASHGGVILDGRDIGTVVLPNATTKIYLTATPAARAERRVKELHAAHEKADFGTIMQQIKDRDEADMQREIAPLTEAPDATLLDTSRMGVEDAVDAVIQIING